MIPRGSSIHKEALGIVESFPSFSPENIVVTGLPKKVARKMQIEIEIALNLIHLNPGKH